MSDHVRTLLFSCGPVPIDRTSLSVFARKLRDEVAGGRPFTCLITRDPALQRLNRDFLGRDYPTDVLSFPSGAREGFLGEIAISADRASEQAAGQGHDTGEEIRILMLHGLLHLLGFDHARDRGGMRRAETRWRKALGLKSGLIERARA
jgi:probable rRNA maturation factor